MLSHHEEEREDPTSMVHFKVRAPLKELPEGISRLWTVWKKTKKAIFFFFFFEGLEKERRSPFLGGLELHWRKPQFSQHKRLSGEDPVF